MKKSIIVEFIGLPGSGKSTVANRVVNCLRDEGFGVGDRDTYMFWKNNLSFLGTNRVRMRALFDALMNFNLLLRSLRLGGAQCRRLIGVLAKARFFQGHYEACRHEIYVFDQWTTQEAWSLMVPETLDNTMAKRLVKLLCRSDYVVFLDASLGVVASRISQRKGGASRFEGRDPLLVCGSLEGTDIKLRCIVDALRDLKVENVQYDATLDPDGLARAIANALKDFFAGKADKF